MHTHLIFVSSFLLFMAILSALVGSLHEGYAKVSNGYSPTFVAPTEEYPVVLYSGPNYEGEAFMLRVGKHTFEDVFPSEIPRPDYKRWIRSVQMLPGATFSYRNAIGGVQDAVYTANRAMIKFRLDNLRNRNGLTDTVTVAFAKPKVSAPPPPPADHVIDGLWNYGLHRITMSADGQTGTIEPVRTYYPWNSKRGTLTKIGRNTYEYKYDLGGDIVSEQMVAVSPNRLEFPNYAWDRFTTPQEFPIEGVWNNTYTIRGQTIYSTINNQTNDNGTVQKTGVNKYTINFYGMNPVYAEIVRPTTMEVTYSDDSNTSWNTPNVSRWEKTG